MNLTQRPIYVKPPKVNKDPAHLARVGALPCIICTSFGLPQLTPTQVHHPICGRYGTRKAPDRMGIPLCADHHLWGGNGYVAIHKDRTEWERLYGQDTDYVAVVLDMLGV